MTSLPSILSGQTFEPPAADAAAAKRRRRLLKRRRTLGMQVLSYMLGALILSLYVHAGTIPAIVPPVFFLSGLLAVGLFLALSETGINDRFADDFLSMPQVALHVAIQYAFLIWMPQIAYAFLATVFLIFCTGALSMTSRQATVAWLLMTVGAVPVFLSTHVPLDMAMNTFGERMAALLAYVASIGQCVFVGLYGNSLRRKLYKSGVELRLAYSRIEELAELDELTGAMNRRSIMRTLDDEITNAQRSERPCSIALMDLDWFKRINDLFGHPTGDEVLRSFAITTFANIRTSDRFGRYGGEEFLLILPDTTTADAVKMLNRLRLIFAELDWSALSPGMSVTISAGVVTLHEDESADSFLARADRSLYAAKRAGRNRVESRE